MIAVRVCIIYLFKNECVRFYGCSILLCDSIWHSGKLSWSWMEHANNSCGLVLMLTDVLKCLRDTVKVKNVISNGNLTVISTLNQKPHSFVSGSSVVNYWDQTLIQSSNFKSLDCKMCVFMLHQGYLNVLFILFCWVSSCLLFFLQGNFLSVL